WKYMLAAEHAHHRDLFLQIRVAKHRAEGGVRIRVQGPVFQVHHVDHVSARPRLARSAVQTDVPFRLRDRGVEFFRIGKRMLGDVFWSVVFPSPQDRDETDDHYRAGYRQNVAINPTRGLGPSSRSSAGDAVAR